MSDGCLHSKERNQTVSGMQASIYRRLLRIHDILCDLQPSQAVSTHTEQVLQGFQVFYYQRQALLPFLLQRQEYERHLHVC